jgi:hypothetical protein
MTPSNMLVRSKIQDQQRRACPGHANDLPALALGFSNSSPAVIGSAMNIPARLFAAPFPPRSS